MLSLDEFVPTGSRAWWSLLAITLMGRGFDLGSTYAGTPRLVNEGNPIARRMGWRYGIPVNGVLSLAIAHWPLLAISVTTTSSLVAARNLQSVWLMRTMGERTFQMWMSDRYNESSIWTVLGCFLGESCLVAMIGGSLVCFSRWQLVPFAIGFGMIIYGIAVAFFTSLAIWRRR
jgi:hypothetical protein